jgi:hypothetical protein
MLVPAPPADHLKGREMIEREREIARRERWG